MSSMLRESRNSKSGARRQAREAALQAIYMCDFLKTWKLASVEFCFDQMDILLKEHKAFLETTKADLEKSYVEALKNLMDVKSNEGLTIRFYNFQPIGQTKDDVIIQQMAWLIGTFIEFTANEAMMIPKHPVFMDWFIRQLPLYLAQYE